ncbi:Chromate transport protein ChrA [Cronobacter universalis NCTC 9529]|uniref:Chromate transporter n=1 Tax=Cronobacter universalis NCTC 9529 TaxID=1074000 RepID=A0AAC8ZR87_9ENTR|nr:chromate efflux transporter [Cronobacter universalis]ALB54619.1 chromate transporter [Cronobacter universalis NCTC 9529]CCK18299.1 Chromate transport protein ChrA [Cronobacter universalis NCTC 9529]STD05404.1 chromate transporter, chromate ion transporter (CHR) family [Cronobacter universalis NCTC 9529]
MKHDMRSDQSPLAVFLIFLRLGLTSFGGPIAHLGYFRHEFVARRKWISDQHYSDLVALCQFLPGPASSQVGIALGLSRAGYAGALAAWAGFTLPSAILLILFALGLSGSGGIVPSGALHGLKVVAVAVVAQAVWGMARTLCPDATRVTIMATAACVLLLFPAAVSQLAVIGAAALAGLYVCKPAADEKSEALTVSPGLRSGAVWLVLFVILLAGLPLLAAFCPHPALAMVNAFYRTGSLVFGGGHVVLPLLQADVVPNGWVSNDTFLAGYGAAQAVPGPLFTFAAFLGASMNPSPSGWEGGLLCLLAIFAPSFLLVAGALPFWERVKGDVRMRAALAGINAAVVGLLLAALYNPVWTSAIHTPQDVCVALVALVALIFWKLPPWLVVVCCGVAGALM